MIVATEPTTYQRLPQSQADFLFVAPPICPLANSNETAQHDRLVGLDPTGDLDGHGLSGFEQCAEFHLVVMVSDIDLESPEQCDQVHFGRQNGELVSHLMPLVMVNGKTCLTYAVAWSVPERHKRLILLITTEESLGNEIAGVGAPELGRSVEIEV